MRVGPGLVGSQLNQGALGPARLLDRPLEQGGSQPTAAVALPDPYRLDLVAEGAAGSVKIDWPLSRWGQMKLTQPPTCCAPLEAQLPRLSVTRR